MASTRPLILLTNDDGIDSLGLLAVADNVADLGELAVAAPCTQQTGMGRALPEKIGEIREVALSCSGGRLPAHAVCGSPAQAVIAAVLVILDRKPDLVISGINYGENLGTSVTSSGTVGAALQAADFGIPAIAVSLETHKSNHYRQSLPVDWTAAARVTRHFARLMLARALPADVDVLKIDVPETAGPDAPWRVTRQSRQPYYETYQPASAAPGQLAARFDYDVRVNWETLEADSDIDVLARQRLISVTPLSVDMTSRTDLNALEEFLRGD
jgi:5'-nucleotidase